MHPLPCNCLRHNTTAKGACARESYYDTKRQLFLLLRDATSGLLPATFFTRLKAAVVGVAFAVTDEKGYVLPDVLINVVEPNGVKHDVVIETMGYTDEDYCERKSEQHKGMRQTGISNRSSKLA